MKILIVSDTHRRDGNLQSVIEKTAPFDMLIHLGDAEGSEERIESWCKAQNEACQVYMILGNNDFFSNLDREKEIVIGRYKAFLTHGHFYSVSVGTERLADECKDRKADIVMFGHTHKPYLDHRDGITILNPGSLSFPRQDGRKPSYMLMEIDKEGEAHYTINYIQ
ncbi:MAG: metallophosphoesterase [Clostridium sp.]